MKNKLFAVSIVFLIIFNISCSNTFSSRNSQQYYNEHKQVLEKIKQTYEVNYRRNAFSIIFQNKGLSDFAIELTTDSLTYIYRFQLHDERLTDTLKKFNINPDEITGMIDQMVSIHSLSVQTFNYYWKATKHSMVHISTDPKPLSIHIIPKKYFVFGFFPELQYFNSKGLLKGSADTDVLLFIGGLNYHKINDSTGYSSHNKFR